MIDQTDAVITAFFEVFLVKLVAGPVMLPCLAITMIGVKQGVENALSPLRLILISLPI
jgi:hypothetical protein